MVERAVGRGEITAKHSPGIAMSALASPLLLSPLMLGTRVPPADVESLVTLVLDATAPPAPDSEH